MKYDIDIELESIFDKYGLLSYKQKKNVESDLINTLQKAKKDGKIAIYGAAVKAKEFLVYLYSLMPELKIDICFDNSIQLFSYKDMIIEEKTHRISDIRKYNISLVIICSANYKEEMISNLKKEKYLGEILEPEGYLEKYGLGYTDYGKIWELKQEYCKNQSSEKLLELIEAYLTIRDFNNAMHLMDIAIEENLNIAIKCAALKEEISNLIEKIRNIISHRSGDDIIVNWIDAVQYDHLKYFPNLKKHSEEGVNFVRSYSPNPWTTEVLKEILKGEYAIEDKTFLDDDFSTQKCKLLKFLKKNGYKIAYFGLNKYAGNFDDSVLIQPEYVRTFLISSVPRYWSMLKCLCNEASPVFMIVHTLNETHAPYVCGEGPINLSFRVHDSFWECEECLNQVAIASRYIDNQLEFYNGLIGDNLCKIYMSDHGRITDSIMREDRVHNFLYINGNKFNAKVVEGLFSLIDFSKLIEYIISGNNNYDELCNDYVKVEALDFYDKNFVDVHLSGSIIWPKIEAMQRRGIITKTDRYARLFAGDEFYAVGEDDKTNRIKEKQYEQRIKYLRELCGSEFIDIYKYDKFKESIRLYEQ